MNLRVLVRAASLIAVALVAWSLNVRWGSSSAVRGGPPIQWERIVVGAALLSAIAALAIWLATRPKIGASRTWLRGIAGGAALAVAAIAIRLRSEAVDRELNDLVNGPGWSWLTAGAAVSIAAAAASFALRGEPDGAPRSAKRRAR
jgi:hypothetical protein